MTIATANPVVEAGLVLLEGARPPRVRTLREFAEDEIVLPDGPYEGRRFQCNRQPYTRLFFDAVDSGRWDRINSTGPTQSGKTLTCCIIPLLYHLFELRETVVFGLPDMDMAADKWREDILPVLKKTQYNALRPTHGQGSRGGTVKSAVKFKNGATLRFMAGGGGDKQRSAFTARVLLITESDGMDEAATGSRESSKIKQLQGRTRAFTRRTGRPARHYYECTVSNEEGFTWTTHKAGTCSRIVLPCPHCRAWVTPAREHLIGWQGAENELQAKADAAFMCPECTVAWTDEQRTAANHRAILVHRGQEITPDGQVVGPLPQTNTLGFRWSAINNLFAEAADVGADEWNATQATDEEEAERELCQFIWAIPPPPPSFRLAPVSAGKIQRRTARLPRGLLPNDTHAVTVGIDVGKWLSHWVVLAWRENSLYVPDYGTIEVDTDRLGLERATLIALRELRDLCTQGWTVDGGGPPAIRQADQVWIDSGWSESAPSVYAFCRETAKGERLPIARSRYRPAKGYGMGQERRTYSRPRATGNIVVGLGEEYHLVRHKPSRCYLVELNANYWKSWIHERLAMAPDEPGALHVFHATPGEHMKFSKHLTAEEQVEAFDPVKGTIRVWKSIRRDNHWFDAICLAAAAGHFVGERIVAEQSGPASVPRPKQRGGPTTPDGRPFFVWNR